MDLPKLSPCFIGIFRKSDCHKPSTYYYGCTILKPIKNLSSNDKQLLLGRSGPGFTTKLRIKNTHAQYAISAKPGAEKIRNFVNRNKVMLLQLRLLNAFLQSTVTHMENSQNQVAGKHNHIRTLNGHKELEILTFEVNGCLADISEFAIFKHQSII
uniref:Uncharacterized protein n=1 Tax=Romanomermis culicivorax TaxID=13658 RepID=A0A915JCK4_ROMCU